MYMQVYFLTSKIWLDTKDAAGNYPRATKDLTMEHLTLRFHHNFFEHCRAGHPRTKAWHAASKSQLQSAILRTQ